MKIGIYSLGQASKSAANAAKYMKLRVQLLKMYGRGTRVEHYKFCPLHSCREPQGKGLVEETDLGVPGHDEVDMGQEWPLHETSDVRSYRQFYQSWCGAVQGAYPMTKVDATRVSNADHILLSTLFCMSIKRGFTYYPCALSELFTFNCV